jgi:hypothetical protein
MKEKGRRVRSQIQIFEYVILLTLMLQYLIEKENSRKKLLTSWCPENRQRDKKGPRTSDTLQRQVPSDLLPLTWSHPMVSTISQ